MSIHVCKCIHNGREEYHLRYPGMSERAAQELASTINGCRVETDIGRLHNENAELRAKLDALTPNAQLEGPLRTDD